MARGNGSAACTTQAGTRGGQAAVKLFASSEAAREFAAGALDEPTPDDGEESPLRQMWDALRFARTHDMTVACIEGGRVVAAICWRPCYGANKTLVSHLGSTRKGLGSLLLRHAAADAASRGEGLYLESLPGAAGFYERYGFASDEISELGYPIFTLGPDATAALALST